MTDYTCTVTHHAPHRHQHHARSAHPGHPAAPKVKFVALPPVGLGYYRYSPAERQFGTPATISALVSVAMLWAAFPAGDGSTYEFAVGDMSFEDGRPMVPHHAHRDGKCIDIRPIRKDKRRLPATYTDADYDPEETQRLVYAFRSNPNVDLIFFNDPKIVGVRPWPGHQNHLHVHFRE